MRVCVYLYTKCNKCIFSPCSKLVMLFISYVFPLDFVLKRLVIIMFWLFKTIGIYCYLGLFNFTLSVLQGPFVTITKAFLPSTTKKVIKDGIVVLCRSRTTGSSHNLILHCCQSIRMVTGRLCTYTSQYTYRYTILLSLYRFLSSIPLLFSLPIYIRSSRGLACFWVSHLFSFLPHTWFQSFSQQCNI